MPPWENYFEKVRESADFLRKGLTVKPQIALILSGGVGTLADGLKSSRKWSSAEIPHFPRSRAEGHAGELRAGLFEGIPLLCMKGRFHYYEGLSPQEVVFPYFVFRELGVETVLSTNAVGGIREDLEAGDIVRVSDHLNLMGANPLIGVSVQKPKNQFPSLQAAYDPALGEIAKKVAGREKITLKEGVYLATPGPSYETPAEVRMFRKLGADTCGMSTVFGVIACNYLKMRVLVFNIVANVSADRHPGEMAHSEVLAVMSRSEEKVLRLMKGVLKSIGKSSA